MRTTYDEVDDILVLHLCDKPIAKEVSQDWNTHVSYAEDGSIVGSSFSTHQNKGPGRCCVVMRRSRPRSSCLAVWSELIAVDLKRLILKTRLRSERTNNLSRFIRINICRGAPAPAR